MTTNVGASGEKVLHFIRHGLAEHNLAFEERPLSGDEGLQLYACEYLDSRLAPQGDEEAAQLAETLAALPDEQKPKLVVVSPLSRALATARRALPNCSTVCVEDFRERNGRWPCERRRPLRNLRPEFPNVDFSDLTEEDVAWTISREGKEAALARAERCLRWLAARPEPVLAVVSHSGFMTMSLFSKSNQVLEIQGEELRDGWANCELRTMVFSHEQSTDTFRARLLRIVRPKSMKAADEERKRRILGAKNMNALYQITKDLGAVGVEKRLRATGKPWYAKL